MAGATRHEVRVHVDAPPSIVYSLVSDVTRMGDWSPETYACEWVDGGTGPVVGGSGPPRRPAGWHAPDTRAHRRRGGGRPSPGGRRGTRRGGPRSEWRG